MRIGGSAFMDTRYIFGPQFICAASFFTREAIRLEREIEDHGDERVGEHRAFVTGAIMQAITGVESEVAEVIIYGPGIHRGSNETAEAGRKLLERRAKSLHRIKPVFERCDRVLQYLDKDGFDREAKSWTEITLLNSLRNYLIHYKSMGGAQMDEKEQTDEEDLLKQIKGLGHASPLFVARASGHMNFFPHHCLGAQCAEWAVTTAIAFIDEFYRLLGVPSALDGHRSRIHLN